MLIRIVLAVDSPEDKSRLRELVARVPDVVTQVARGTDPRWDRLAGMQGDLLLVSRSLIPSPPQTHLTLLRNVPDSPEVVVVADGEDAEGGAQLLAAGCYAVLDKRLNEALLLEALSAIIARRRQDAEAKLTLPQDIEASRLSDFVSRSAAMQAFMEVVERVVPSDTTLLLVGETGVGKERLAQAIHAEGPRAQGPFVAVNCGAIPESLLESELFGHMAGAFTGATRARRGWFELAHSGTIFLDEIGEMPLHLQVKLLRVLQTHDVVPVGAEHPLKVDVRVMAATNRDLEEEAREKRFRQDLYYRLSVVTLEIPPLRERQDDIRTLVERYIRYFQSKFHTSVESFSEAALQAMTEYDWPGNVRELVNVVERVALLCPDAEVSLEDLPEAIRGQSAPNPVWSTPGGGDCLTFQDEWKSRPLRDVRRELLDLLEVRYLRALLEETGGRIEETAKRAGINARNLFEKMRRHGIRKEEFRGRAKSG